MKHYPIRKAYFELIKRLLTFSARTQVCFTIRKGSPFLDAGPRHIEVILDDHSLDRPRTVIIPAKANILNADVARVFFPTWMSSPEYYSIMEKYLCIILKIDYVPERYVPIISLPRKLYFKFIEQNRLALTKRWTSTSQEALVFYEFGKRDNLTWISLKGRDQPDLELFVHLEIRGD